MKGNTILKRHTDNVGENYKFTYHLGLKCPEGCHLHHFTLGQTVEENGKHIIFDARLPHWAENSSEEDRVILYIEYYAS
jgi:aspartyl/asparaginyl beta-hydroxylase (cupin superfamily)